MNSSRPLALGVGAACASLILLLIVPPFVPRAGRVKSDVRSSQSFSRVNASHQVQHRPEPSKSAACQNCKIFVLELADVAEDNHIPACNLSDPMTWPYSQPGHPFEGSEQLQAYDCQSAGPYYLAEQLRHSCHRAADIDEADIVFVNSYCYLMWWIACIHRGVDCQDQQGSYHLDRVLRAVIRSERFQRNHGRDFVFYRPVVADIMFEGLWQQTYAGIHLVNERGQLEFGAWDKHRHFTVPYSSTNDRPPFEPALQRTTRVFFRGGCDANGSPGKVLRQSLVDVFDKLNHDDTDVACACAQCPGHASHAELMTDLQQSEFCLLPSGDTPSSRRLTEIVLAGCIPVFIGPPYHTLPFAHDVDYKAFALFFNVTSLETLKLFWHDHLSEGYRPPERLDMQNIVINVQSLEEIADALVDRARFTEAEIDLRRQALLSYKNRFVFQREPDGDEPDAVTTIIDNVCQVARNDRVLSKH